MSIEPREPMGIHHLTVVPENFDPTARGRVDPSWRSDWGEVQTDCDEVRTDGDEVRTGEE